jgi:hypothetical protein
VIVDPADGLRARRNAELQALEQRLAAGDDPDEVRRAQRRVRRTYVRELLRARRPWVMH